MTAKEFPWLWIALFEPLETSGLTKHAIEKIKVIFHQPKN